MATNGGKRPGAGRPKGSKSKKTLAVEAKLEELGCDPIEGMAKIAQAAFDAEDFQLAGNMYKELAQYVAPKRKAIEHSGKDGGPVEHVFKWSE